MAKPANTRKTFSPALITVCALVVVALIVGGVYLSRPAPAPASSGPASAEAKAYLSNLELSDVNMQATENFMKQQVVEVTGKITNKGPRALASIDVYCVFYGVDGREIHRERLPIVSAKGGLLGTGQTRAFRLPFDALPDGWNQAVPRLVIAQIVFAT